MNADSKVLVVGAGIGGLGAGAALGQKGLECEIVEIRPTPEVFGVGINQPGNSLRALDALGVLDDVLSAGYQFDGWDFHGPDGELAVAIDSHLADDRVPHNNGLARRDLHKILLGAANDAGVSIRFGTTIADVREERDDVQVTFSDGSVGRYGLVAAFDGVKSTQRDRMYSGAHQPAYAGVAIWRVTVPRPADVVRGVVYQSVDAKAGCIPLSREEMYLFLVTPEPWDVRVDRELLPAMLRDRLGSFGGLIGEIRDGLTDADDVVYSRLLEVMLPAPWSSGRVVICGDAAHACAPHITQGAAMALEDAVVLAEELAAHAEISQALRSFNQRRYPRAKFVQDISRAILDAEMSVTHETLPMALQGMREHLPEQMSHVDSVLLAPA